MLGLGASRVRLSTDLAAALPHDGEIARAFADIQRFSLLDTALVEVNGTGHTEAELHAAIDALGAVLSAREDFASVRYRYTLEDGIRLRQAAEGHLAELTPPTTLAERLSSEGMAATLARARARMFGPAGSIAARALLTDPLDLGGAFVERVEAMGKDGSTVVRGGHLLAVDGLHGLIFARPTTPALGTTLDAPLLQHLEADLAASPLPARWIGSHRYAAEAAAQIHDEVNVAVTVDLVLMAALFVVVFRSLRPLLGTPVPLLVAACAGGAMAALRSPVHAVALAFGGALAGMGVDYWIHLYLTAIRDGVAADFRARLHQGQGALRELGPAYAISIGATLTAFGMLATSSYQAVADLGFIGMGTAGGALLGVVLAGPWVYAALARPGDPIPWLPVPAQVPGWVAVPCLVGMVGLGFVAFGVRFDGNPRAMDARLESTAALEREITDRYGGEATSALVVAEGPSLDAALLRLAPAAEVLRGCTGLTIKSPLPLLPDPASRVEVGRLTADRAAIEARFAEAAAAAGFEPAPLLDGLRRSVWPTTTGAALGTAAWEGTPAAEILSRVVRVGGPSAGVETGVGSGQETALESTRASGGQGASVALILTAVSTDALDHARHELDLAGLDVRFVQPARVGADGADHVRTELVSRSGLALAAVILFMAVRYRDPVKVLAASLPSLCAAAGTLGVCAWSGVALTPASGPAFVLVLGVAFDQGIFMVEAGNVSPSAYKASRAAILIALATAFTGFAGLLIARHPAVHSIGLVVSLGIAFCALGAFGLVPALLTAAGERWTRRMGRRALWVGVVGVQLDALVALVGQVRPPAGPAEEPPLPASEQGPTLGAAWSASPIEAAATPTVDRRVGPNRLVREHGLWILRVEGNARDIGRISAVLAGGLPAQNERALREEFNRHVPNLLAQYLLVRGTPLLAQAMAPHIPAPFLDELAGYAEGVPDPLGWVAPIYTRKLCYHAIHDVGQAMVDSPLLACTGFAAGAERTVDGHWLLARNFDFDGGRMFDEDKAVVVVKREGAIPFVHVAIVGLSGVVSGVNAAGIAVAVLAGASDAPPRPGDPMIFILREILENARTLGEVRDILDARRGFVSEGILAVDGTHGEAAVFEVTPEDVTRLDPGMVAGPGGHLGSAIALANHFRGAHAEDMANHLREIEGTSVARLARMEELLTPSGGPLDTLRAITLLRDRAGVGDHSLPAGHEQALNADIASHGVVIDATARTVTVSTFPSLAGPFVRYRLDDLLDGRIRGEIVAEADTPARTWHTRLARSLVATASTQPAPEAEATLRRALTVNPGDVDATLALARLLLDVGRPAEARPLLQTLLATPPERAADARAARLLLTRTEQGD